MVQKFSGVLFDINGVLEFQGEVYPGAVDLLDFLRNKGIAFRIISNSTLKSRQDCTEKLNRQGFENPGNRRADDRRHHRLVHCFVYDGD